MVEIKSTFLETCSVSDALHFSSAMMQLITKEFLGMYLEDQRDAVLSSLLFVVLPSHSTCFGCLPHPSSGVPKL